MENNTALAVTMRPRSSLKAAARNPRTHSDDQVRRLAQSLLAYGWTNPVLVADDGEVIAGHGRLAAADRLWAEGADIRNVPAGMVPCIALSGLSAAERRAYLIADNQFATQAGWDEEMLKLELGELQAEGFDLSLTGFDDLALGAMMGGTKGLTDADDMPPPPKAPRTSVGETWCLGDHRLHIGDSTTEADLQVLFDSRGLAMDSADMVFTDPPYAIYGSSTGVSADVADDKMVRPFFRDIIKACTLALKPFGHAYICCDWRSWASWWEVAKGTGLMPKNMIVWDKTTPGMGSNYQNQHELLMFAAVRPVHHGMTDRRHGERTVTGAPNVWCITRAGREETGEKRIHNAQKPVALVTTAIENSTEPGGVVVDFFGGSGTTAIACEKTGRVCLTMEIEPRFAELSIRRWETYTGRVAKRQSDGATLADLSRG